MNDDIKVSVVVVTFGHEKYIRKTLDSILMQDVDFKYEVIIGEDCSPDNTRTILFEYRKRFPNVISLVLRDKNIGATKNYYDIYNRCKGTYIATLEGDDYWTDAKKLQKQVCFLENNKEYIGCSHNYEVVDKDEKHIYYWRRKKQLNKEYSMDSLLHNETFPHMSTLMFRNIFIDSTESFEIIYKAHKLIGDVTLYAILLDKSHIYVLRDTMSAYRFRIVKNDMNWASLQRTNIIQSCKESIEMFSLLNEYFEGRYDFSNVIAMCIGTNAFEYIVHGKSYVRKVFLGLVHLVNDLIPKQKFSCFIYLLRIAFFRTVTFPARKLRRTLSGAKIFDVRLL